MITPYNIRIGRVLIELLCCMSIFTRYATSVEISWDEPPTEDQKQAVRTHVQHMIQEAETLSQDGKYAEALRLLFDALSLEERMQLAIAFFSDERLPITAAEEIIRLEKWLIRQDPSPLMHWFRDVNIPLPQKREAISELRTLAEHEPQEGHECVFRGQYRGTLVQLMTSPLLSTREQFDILFWVESVIREEYTSEAEQHHMQKDIIRLRGEAEQKFRIRQYLEAFVLISEAVQKARDIQLYRLSAEDDHNLFQQEVSMRKQFVHIDQSPLMQVFKDRELSTKKRQLILYELRAILWNHPSSGSGGLVLQGTEYTGALVDILTHPQVDRMTQDSLLDSIDVEILKKEPDYLPDWMWSDDEEFMKLWEEYHHELKTNDNN